MSLKTYGLDQMAQRLVLVCRPFPGVERNSPEYRSQDVFSQAYKMRTTVAYGLERFWGEHLRLGSDTAEGRYWKDVWDTLVEDILKPASITIPNDSLKLEPPPLGHKESKDAKKRREEANIRQIHSMADKLWKFAQENPNDQRIALSVLTHLCDCIVWWTQRYKG
jgi:hypothetical protein